MDPGSGPAVAKPHVTDARSRCGVGPDVTGSAPLTMALGTLQQTMELESSMQVLSK